MPFLAPQPLLPPPALQQAVARALGDNNADWLPMAGGRSNHLWRLGDRVVKLYRPDAASPLFPNDLAAEATALRHLAGSDLAPHLCATGAGWLAYTYIPGAPWRQGVAPVALALARLHGQNVGDLALRRSATGDLAVMADAQAIAAQCAGALPPLPPIATVPPTPARLIHGDAVPGNLIAGPGGITLIDWQCPALGDPVDDLVVFLSPAMQFLYRGAPLTGAESADFLAAYPDPETVARYHALRPLLHWRIAAHCLWKSERAAPDYAQALALELAAL